MNNSSEFANVHLSFYFFTLNSVSSKRWFLSSSQVYWPTTIAFSDDDSLANLVRLIQTRNVKLSFTFSSSSLLDYFSFNFYSFMFLCFITKFT